MEESYIVEERKGKVGKHYYESVKVAGMIREEIEQSKTLSFVQVVEDLMALSEEEMSMEGLKKKKVK